MIVVAAALVADDRHILVQRRPAGKVHGGLWEFPGGKIEPGETAEAALARELAEELGIAVEATAMTPLTFATGAASGRPLVLLLYLVRVWTGEPSALAADALAWHTTGELARLPMPPADAPLLAVLVRACRFSGQPAQL